MKPDETGWLIETQNSNCVAWLFIEFKSILSWTVDSTLAVRFARKEDAEAVIKLMGLTACIATEHMWSDI